MDNIVIAVDGPAGAGKSTIAKIIAGRLNINYIDTGAMYRAITYKCIKNNVSIDDEKKVIDICKNSLVDFRSNSIYIDGVCVDSEIRTLDVSSKVSNVAKIKEVREMLVERQRILGKDRDVILDGRDVGTYIFPDTKFKYFLNASIEIRGRRRYEELIAKGETISLEDIIEDVRKRDEIDASREFAPLIKAIDSIEIDTSNMSIDEVVDYIINDVKSRV